MHVPSLHRQFARTKATPEGICRFADRYGFLGHTGAGHLPLDRADTVVSEPLQMWKDELKSMKGFLALWDAVRTGRRETLAPFVYWQDHPTRVVRLIAAVDEDGIRPDVARRVRQRSEDLSTGLLAWRERPEGVWLWTGTLAADSPMVDAPVENTKPLHYWKYGDPIEPVRFFIHLNVNHRVHGHVSPAVLPFKKNSILFFPDCLLSALYVHFMLELSGRTRPAALCARPDCGRYFEPKHGSQRYCEDRCRKLRYWHRDNGGEVVGDSPLNQEGPSADS